MGDVQTGHHSSEYWQRHADGRVTCTLCPRYCTLREGKRGVCFVRRAWQGEIELTSYGRSSGFCIDPIEKKPLNHFLPGTPVLSFGTAGCNLSCRFCQNWDISKSRQLDTLAASAGPAALARVASQRGCRSVAFTYNDPVIFLEYALAVAEACHRLGLMTVAVTAGYINPAPRRAFFARMDAVNLDLKAFSQGFYHQVCGGALKPVLETLVYLRHHTDCWLEITTLLIPGLNDSSSELEAMCRWLVRELGPEVPLHFTAFHPDYRMRDRPPTPLSTLVRARAIAQEQGLHFVYTGNVHDPEGSSSYCPGCGSLLIERDWYRLGRWQLDDQGRCRGCGTALPGRFEAQPGQWGPRRLPVQMG
ncbi:AmmeMemoRadiSam system radical SAM enzyme [Ferrimonas marina]|uniref:Pyruvate formate lyase activating enzyme n=1 Tax=Ferrimonas marina TaxID=299255 RepID=A0A1M5VQ81_9GAMM|nr:AmmeMemoRadiSam system radical SAM enzyme [Ferrimonas marina]SHH77441.1 pyruvate formate lyase activating enzyme [Ferrimonas marina]